MKLERPEVRALFRGPGLCEFCLAPCRARECAHIYSVGAGRVDHPWNLVALGSTLAFQCECHTRNHNGNQKPFKADLECIVAMRERIKRSEIKQLVHLIRRLDRDTTIAEAERLVALEFGRVVKL